MSKTLGEELIDQLLSQPLKFDQAGKAYELLQEYFEGFPLETLRPLLRNDDGLVKRAAIWIASELGKDASVLLPDILSLINFEDRYIKFHVIECITVCSFGENAKEFIHVVHALQDNDSIIRVRAMELISYADKSQLEATLTQLRDNDTFSDIHKYGLTTLLEDEVVEVETILKMTSDKRILVRKYGAILAKKLLSMYPELIKNDLSSEDDDIKSFFENQL